jgi:hypothetical protein
LTKKSKRYCCCWESNPAPPAHTVHIRRFRPYIRRIYGRPKPIYGHTVTEPVAQCHIRYRIYGVPRIRRKYGHTVWANPTSTVKLRNHFRLRMRVQHLYLWPGCASLQHGVYLFVACLFDACLYDVCLFNTCLFYACSFRFIWRLFI